MNLERLGVVAGAVADLAIHIHVGKKVHLDALGALALASFTAAAFHVEGEPAGLVAADLRLTRFREDFADFVEHPGVGRRSASRRAAVLALIDLGDLLDSRDSDQRTVTSCLYFIAVELAL